MLEKLRNSIGLFLIVSLLVHLFMGTSLLTMKKSEQTPRPSTIEIEVVHSMDPAAEEKLKRIVEQQKQINDEVPEETDLLSQFNQRVVKQTRADKAGEFKNTAIAGVKKSGQPEQEKKPEPTRSKVKDALPSLKNLSPQFSMTPKVKNEETGNAGAPSQTDDYLKEVDKGIQTLLSTREFVFYSYYSRIRQQIRQYWEPNVKQKVKIIYRSGRTIASASDHVTQLVVTLNKEGELEKVEVVGASGVKDLDDAAIEAFRSAAPFPNPPKGIVEKDGRIRIRWDFILEARTAPSQRFERIIRNTV